jgi:glycosyltransferase involved in cell wall biosynthesis
MSNAGSTKKFSLSIIIPTFNEEEGIFKTLTDLCGDHRLNEAEIIVVDDGSTDQTNEIVQQFPRVRLVKHNLNKGYGASISSGVKASNSKFVVWCDSDGQHQAEDVSRVSQTLIDEDLDYCIGVRDKSSYQTTDRKIGRFGLKLAVNIAASQPVKDFNSGLRGFKRDVIRRYLHLLPKRFGASTTTTLIMIERGYSGKEVIIHVQNRVGKSTVNPILDGARTLLLVLRIFLLFKPLLFFGSIGLSLIIFGSMYGFTRAITSRQGFPVFAALVIIFGLQSLFFGLLADQISAVRREKFD